MPGRGYTKYGWREDALHQGRTLSVVLDEMPRTARMAAGLVALFAQEWSVPQQSGAMSPPEMSAITHLFAGVPVSDLDVSIDWYTRFFGRPPDMRVGEEILWEIDDHATLFIEPGAARAGTGRITLAVAGLDALLQRLAAQRIEHEPVETYSNGVRHVNVPDPDGNAIAFAEPPDAASASPRE
jgi:catechol 2,3-dioxygenase-like lactoylglutathione lyase family enzyme